jgi:uncharacterized membrane protein
MEYASEMVINAGRAGLKVAEFPITYSAREGESKLNSMRDGWRHLRLMLLYSPLHLFLVPGALMLLLGLLAIGLTLSGTTVVGGRMWDMHTTMVGSLLAVLGIHTLGLGFLARSYALAEGFVAEERDPIQRFLSTHFSFEKGLIFGGLVFLVGLGIVVWVVANWASVGFDELNAIKPLILAATLMTGGAQIGFISAVISLFEIRKAADAI